MRAGGDALCAALFAGDHGGELNMLKALKVMLCVLPCTLEATEGGLCLLEALELMCCVLLCLPEMPEVLKVMRCVLQAVVGSVCWRLWKVRCIYVYYGLEVST